MHTYMGSVYHVFTNKSIPRFAYLFVEKIVDTMYIVLERLLHNTILLHVAMKLRDISSAGSPRLF